MDVKVMMIDLERIVPNAENPRTITEENLEKLIRSLLVFPKMMQLRPVVVNRDMVVMGGNMRYKALSRIAQMSDEELEARIRGLRNRDDQEKGLLLEDWKVWKDNPVAYVRVEELSQQEAEQFVIKDNVSYGTWDHDMLENFNREDLEEWGVTSWEGFGGIEVETEEPQKVQPQEEERQRIIISFEVGREELVKTILGVDELKMSYKVEDLV